MKWGKNLDQAISYVDEVNPLWLTDHNRELIKYKTISLCYKDFLERLFISCPKGYIDLPLMLVDNYGLALPAAELIARRFKNLTIRNDVVRIDWKKGGRERDLTLMCIVQGMQEWLQTSFKREDWLGGLGLFKESFNIDQLTNK